MDFSSNIPIYAHFSIDDSNSIFEDLTKNNETYRSIFDCEILSFLKKLHDTFGITVSFYLFYSWDTTDTNRFNLSESTGAFKEEFEKNSNWY